MDQQLQPIFESVVARNPDEVEFRQTVREIFESLEPVIKRNPGYLEGKILERICEPERQITFCVPQVDDRGTIQIDRGFRAEFNSALGPYKGGLWFHPSVCLSITKLLGSEQIFKNSLTDLPIGGGKGGPDFNPRGRSDAEVMRFCQSFMTELYCHPGECTGVSADDTDVGDREIGYMFDQYKRITNRYESSMLTGKDLGQGGSLVRTEATGYGVVAFARRILKTRSDTFGGKRVTVSGSGNMTIHAIEKVQQLGGRVVACPDSSGYVIDETGIDVGLLKQIKEVERGRIADYASRRDNAELGRTGSIWDVAADVVLPCTTQNELNGEHAATLIRNGVRAVVGGVNMLTAPEGIHAFQEAGVLFAPGKTANAGGVATSGLEMQQSAMRGPWAFEYTRECLTGIMRSIRDMCAATAEECDTPGDHVVGANITGFIRVANAMQASGLV